MCVFAERRSASELCFWFLRRAGQSWRLYRVLMGESANVLMADGGARTSEYTHTIHIQYCICNNCIPCQQWDYRKCAFWQEKSVCACVCVIRLWVCSVVVSTSGPGHVNKPRAAESVLRKAQKDIKDRGGRRGRKERRKHYYSNSTG